MFTDNFTYGGTPPAAENLGSRAGWTLQSGTASVANVANGATVLNHNASVESAWRCTDQGSADHYTQCLLLGANGFICIRMTDISNFIGFRHNGTAFQVYKRVAGTFTQLGSDYTASLSGSNVVRLSASGSTLTFTVDGVGRCGSPFTESFNSTETRQGVISRGSGATSWIDDFEADVVGGGGSSTVPNQIITPNQTIALGSAARRFV